MWFPDCPNRVWRLQTALSASWNAERKSRGGEPERLGRTPLPWCQINRAAHAAQGPESAAWMPPDRSTLGPRGPPRGQWPGASRVGPPDLAPSLPPVGPTEASCFPTPGLNMGMAVTTPRGHREAQLRAATGVYPEFGCWPTSVRACERAGTHDTTWHFSMSGKFSRGHCRY